MFEFDENKLDKLFIAVHYCSVLVILFISNMTTIFWQNLMRFKNSYVIFKILSLQKNKMGIGKKVSLILV